jgi:dTDP-4-dehydrorhamnose reductase
MATAWITGAGGLIGSHIVQAAPAGWRPIGLQRRQLDIADFSAVRHRFETERPDAIIHCAAISKATECQHEPHLAWRINTDATKLLAELAADRQFVFFSTDLVFDGKKGRYTETDAPNPLNVYAKTKLGAEQAVLANTRHLVIRTSLNGGPSPHGDRSFTEQLITLWKAGKSARLFSDEFRSPIMAAVTARAVWELLENRRGGLLHIAGSERLSRYQIGQIIANQLPQLHPHVQRASLHDYPGPPRPPDTSLDISKAQSLLSFPLPGLSEWLKANPIQV